MAQRYQIGNYEVEGEVVELRGRRPWLPWLLFALTLCAAAVLAWKVYWPLRRAHAEQGERVAQGAAEQRALKKQLISSRAELEDARDHYQGVKVELAGETAKKEAALAELKRLQDDLSSQLEVEIKSGDVRISRRGGELVVDVADKVLFDTGAVAINERGQQVLQQVSVILARMEGFQIRVGGHTDNVRIVSPELREQYPTNWELSTARATQVVRFLEDRGKIAGSRLIAAGFAQYRPAASNADEEGRRKNRRIEIVLLPQHP